MSVRLEIYLTKEDVERLKREALRQTEADDFWGDWRQLAAAWALDGIRQRIGVAAAPVPAETEREGG